MDGFPELGKGLALLGLAMVIAGLALMFFDRIPWLGRLPGDLHFQGKHVTVYVPIATCILISLILTAVFHFFFRR